MKYNEATSAIYQAAISKYEYLSYDNFANLGVKCCVSLYLIKTPESKEKLSLLLQSNDKIVADKASCLLGIFEI